MAWNNSTGFKDAFLAKKATSSVNVLANDLTFTTNKIQSGSSGLGSFAVDDWVTVFGGTNNNICAKVLVASAAELEFAANTFTAESSGNDIAVLKITGGSFEEIMRNGILRIFDGSRPASADDTESGTLLVEITADGNAFTSGASLNGLNMGQLTNSVLKRGIDPATGVTEVWQGNGLAAGTAQWGRWYANDVVTGASTTAIRRDGTVVTTSGGDIVMASGRDIAVGVPAVVTEISISLGS